MNEENNLPEDDLQNEQPDEPVNSQDMEVHHHAHEHHGKKSWKNYFWEFMMLFLAVFCGFMAEWQLEHVIENHREEVFVKSMIEDAKIDTAAIHIAIKQIKLRAENLDSLARLCMEYNASGISDARMYEHYISAVMAPALVNPADRTMRQLMNSGGMRLIRNKTASDAILNYDDVGKRLLNQQGYYERAQTRSIEMGFAYFNLRNFNLMRRDGKFLQDTSPESLRLLNTDKQKLAAFGNSISLYEGILIGYGARLAQLEQQAVSLIATLEKEYDPEHE